MLGDNVTKALRNLNELGPTLEALVEEMRVLHEVVDGMRALREQLEVVTTELQHTSEQLARGSELAERTLELARSEDATAVEVGDGSP